MGIICANNNTAFSLNALENGTQSLKAVVNGHDATYLIVNDTGNSSFALTYTGSAQGPTQPMQCGNSLTSTLPTLCSMTGIAGTVVGGAAH